MGTQVKDLEKKLQKKDNLRNEVIPTDEENIVYVGEATDLSFERDGDIQGLAKLSKYKRVEGTKLKGKIQWSPLGFQIQKVPSIKDKMIWTIDSYYHVYFLRDGKLKTEYKTTLKRKAINKGMVLTNKLFEMVFEPIDSQIMEMYQQFRDE